MVRHTLLPLRHTIPHSVTGRELKVLPVASLPSLAVPGGGDEAGAAPGQAA